MWRESPEEGWVEPANLNSLSVESQEIVSSLITTTKEQEYTGSCESEESVESKLLTFRFPPSHTFLSSRQAKVYPNLPSPSHTQEFLTQHFSHIIETGRLKPAWVANPKSPLQNHIAAHLGENAKYTCEIGCVDGAREPITR